MMNMNTRSEERIQGLRRNPEPFLICVWDVSSQEKFTAERVIPTSTPMKWKLLFHFSIEIYFDTFVAFKRSSG